MSAVGGNHAPFTYQRVLNDEQLVHLCEQYA